MGDTAREKMEESIVNELVPVEIEPAQEDVDVEFTPQELERLKRVKLAIARGDYNEVTDEYRKLLFVQWLIENDKLRS